MVYSITTESPQQIILGETDEVNSILQNVYLILATKKNTVPLYRDFGLEMKFIDRPSAVALTMAVAEIKEALQEFEPRVKVIDVDLTPTNRGVVISVKVEVTG